jgi:flagellar basal body-associated protein FliL
MRKEIFIVLGVLVLVFGGMYFFQKYNDNKEKDNNTTNETPKSISKDNFTLTTEYLGNSKWKYNVKGTLPNPCYTIRVDALVRESYPEQVVVNIGVTEPGKDIACIQVVQEYEKTFDIEVSEKATFDLNVLENN